MDDPTTSGVTEGFDLMFYNARWYDPSLGRFAQADTIVPGGVQGLDRYAYVNNSPINYIDPSGHRPCDDEFECSQRPFTNRLITPAEEKRGELMRYMNDEILNKNHDVKQSLDPLDAMLMVVEKAAGIYGDDWEGFLDITTWIFTGYYGSGSEAMWEAHEAGENFDGFFTEAGDADFHPDFQDRSNQVRHFWAAFSTAANPNGDNLLGVPMASVGNFIHDVGEDWIMKPHTTVMDYQLSLVGIDIAKQVGSTITNPAGLSPIFANRLGTSGPGYILESNGPVYINNPITNMWFTPRE
jgi:RHS repeat-associated protein